MLTAGKITVATAVSGILIFAFIFIFNAGKTELMKVEAQTATTTLTVLNTPPVWVATSTELIESSATSPTNSDSSITWVAVATDPNQPNYYLLICSTSDLPSSTNSGAPHCNNGIEWGVSAATPVNTQATVSTTTLESAPFLRGDNDWFAWICDDDADNARCNATFTQGINATNSSPFVVNYRPVFDTFTDDSPANPGALVTFTSSSSDPDGDDVRLFVCNSAGFTASTTSCTGTNIASTSPAVLANAGATYTFPNVIRDQNYNAFGYLVDEFNHAALAGAQGTDSILTVNNVAPTIASSSIVINGGLAMVITNEASETNGFTLAFETSDANSCRNDNASTTNNYEITNFIASLYHATATNACDAATAGDYDPNDCYTSAVATTTWNLNCTASTTSCGVASTTDPTMNWSCTFPLWYVTNPTDNGPFILDNWKAEVAGVDDDFATGTPTESASGVEVNSFPSMDLLTAAIPYGQLEPGQNSGTLTSSTTIQATGNTGLDQNFSGQAMCGTFTATTTCPNSASSTIPESEQEFATSSVAYGSGTSLSSTTPQLLDMNIAKPTSTTTPTSGVAYWGIAVPGSITLAGSYTGLNTFSLVASY